MAAATAMIALALPAAAAAKVPPSLHKPANCVKLKPAPGHAAFKCDDGIPEFGGRTPNPGGQLAITVPAKYRGYRGLPRKADDARGEGGADGNGDVALDVDVTLPSTPAPEGGYPLLFMTHGCCAGSKTAWHAESFDAENEHWHYSNAWFAARGYLVVSWTSRGFHTGERDGSRGSTGVMRLQSRSYEINDYQHMACQMLGAAGRFSDVTGERVRVDPGKVVATSGSYGGGFAWLAVTDPKWTCTADTGARGKRMSLAAAAPKYGFTDLVYEIAPTGLHFDSPKDMPAFNGCDSAPVTIHGKPCPPPATPFGIAKQAILAGILATGRTGIPPGSAHTTLPPDFDAGALCLEALSPPEASSLCNSMLNDLTPLLMRESSAYYQNRFFRKIRTSPSWRVPVFTAGTFQDPLFPGIQQRVIVNRLRSVPGYPVQEYVGEFQHFVQNKAKEWGDICRSGGERHVCTNADFANGFDAAPPSRVRVGATTLLNRFLDHFALGEGRRPRFDATASLQACPENAAALGVALDEPGPTFRARNFGALTPDVLDLRLEGTFTTFSRLAVNPHALSADPILNERLNGRRCPVETGPAGPGVAVYESAPLGASQTMIGGTTVTVDFLEPLVKQGLMLNARLYDVFPDGDAVMVDRGPRRISAAEAESGRIAFQLHGNGWRFERGHSIRIELAQDDFPFLKPSDIPSSMTLTGVRLQVPVR